MFIENILGTESKVKIIRTLLEINTAFTMEDLEKETGLSRGIIHRELKNLVYNGIVLKVEKQGKLGYYRIHLENQYVQVLTTLFNLEEKIERKGKIPLVTWNMLASLVSKIISQRFDIYEIILYGSEARGTASIHSDIDIMIVPEEDWLGLPEEIYQIVKEIQKKSGREINVDYMPRKTYESGGTAMINETKRDGIVLYTPNLFERWRPNIRGPLDLIK